MTQPKPISEMSDAELSEWLAVNVMGYRLGDKGWYWYERDDGWPTSLYRTHQCPYDSITELWNPANVIEQAFLCLERVEVREAMTDVLNALMCIWQKPENKKRCGWQEFLLTCSARIRCEAIVEAMRGTGS